MRRLWVVSPLVVLTSISACAAPVPDIDEVLTPGVRPSYPGPPEVSDHEGLFDEIGGCLSFIPREGEEMLVLAPFGTQVRDNSLAVPGTGELSLTDDVVVSGAVKEVYKSPGETAPAAWGTCVGDAKAHPVMLVIEG